MATSSVPVAYQQRFHDDFIDKFQQMDSRLSAFVRTDPDELNGLAGYWDILGPQTMQEVVGRNQDTPITEVDHTRRRITLRTYTVAPLRDRRDLVRLGRDPIPKWTAGALFAANRQKDELIIGALGGNAYSTDEDLASSASALPSAQKIAHGSAGLTWNKLVEAGEKLNVADVDPDMRRILAVHGKQMADLVKLTETKSRDFLPGQAVVEDGMVKRIAGFDVVMTNLLGVDGSSNRLNYAWVPEAMGLAVGEDITSDVFVRRDKNGAVQTQVWMDLDATRLLDEGVVEIACTES